MFIGVHWLHDPLPAKMQIWYSDSPPNHIVKEINNHIAKMMLLLDQNYRYVGLCTAGPYAQNLFIKLFKHGMGNFFMLTPIIL